MGKGEPIFFWGGGGFDVDFSSFSFLLRGSAFQMFGGSRSTRICLGLYKGRGMGGGGGGGVMLRMRKIQIRKGEKGGKGTPMMQ